MALIACRTQVTSLAQGNRFRWQSHWLGDHYSLSSQGSMFHNGGGIGLLRSRISWLGNWNAAIQRALKLHSWYGQRENRCGHYASKLPIPAIAQTSPFHPCRDIHPCWQEVRAEPGRCVVWAPIEYSVDCITVAVWSFQIESKTTVLLTTSRHGLDASSNLNLGQLRCMF